VVILVVEDEALIGMALCVILRVAGHRVCGPARSVEDALERAADEPPDLALVEVRLEGDAEGLGLARVLRDRYNTACVYLTSSAEVAGRARDAAIGVIEKPYSLDAVQRTVEFVAANRRGCSSMAAPRGLQLFH
jgi:two-component system, response regulator PdtaR